MSYIRSGSNPEKLYIWGDAEDIVHISVGSVHGKTIPENIFHGLIRKYHRSHCGDADFKGASIKEVWVTVPRSNMPDKREPRT